MDNNQIDLLFTLRYVPLPEHSHELLETTAARLHKAARTACGREGMAFMVSAERAIKGGEPHVVVAMSMLVSTENGGRKEVLRTAREIEDTLTAGSVLLLRHEVVCELLGKELS